MRFVAIMYYHYFTKCTENVPCGDFYRYHDPSRSKRRWRTTSCSFCHQCFIIHTVLIQGCNRLQRRPTGVITLIALTGVADSSGYTWLSFGISRSRIRVIYRSKTKFLAYFFWMNWGPVVVIGTGYRWLTFGLLFKFWVTEKVKHIFSNIYPKRISHIKVQAVSFCTYWWGPSRGSFFFFFTPDDLHLQITRKIPKTST